jgi:hypothetical protein
VNGVAHDLSCSSAGRLHKRTLPTPQIGRGKARQMGSARYCRPSYGRSFPQIRFLRLTETEFGPFRQLIAATEHGFWPQTSTPHFSSWRNQLSAKYGAGAIDSDAAIGQAEIDNWGV